MKYICFAFLKVEGNGWVNHITLLVFYCVPIVWKYVWYVIHTFRKLQTATLQRKQHSKIRHQHTLYKERQLRLKIMVNGWCVILVWKKRKKKDIKQFCSLIMFSLCILISVVLLAHYVFHCVQVVFAWLCRSWRHHFYCASIVFRNAGNVVLLN